MKYRIVKTKAGGYAVERWCLFQWFRMGIPSHTFYTVEEAHQDIVDRVQWAKKFKNEKVVAVYDTENMK